MNIKVLIHKEKDGFWAEVPSIPGCATQADTFPELIDNINEAIEGCLSIDVEKYTINDNTEVYELAL